MCEKYHIIINTTQRDRPKDHELQAALIIADYFQSDVVFLRTSCQRTPDFKIGNQMWELKSPLGNSKNTIKNNLHTAKRQSTNVILDLSRCKMRQNKAFSQINYYFKSHHSQISHLLAITKTKKVLEIF